MRLSDSAILLLTCLQLTVPTAVASAVAPDRRHKSEHQITRMTWSELVDEWVNEDIHHRFDVLDEHSDVILKYVRRDPLKAMPRLIEIMDEYDPTRFREGKGRRGERFDACLMLVAILDGTVVRLRASQEGRRAIDAVERAVERMRRAGYADKDTAEFQHHSRFTYSSSQLRARKEINLRDSAIQASLRLEYKIILSDAELLAFTNFLIAQHPEYPTWTDTNLIKDPTLTNEAGYPLQFLVLKRPERFRELYLKFKARSDPSQEYKR